MTIGKAIGLIIVVLIMFKVMGNNNNKRVDVAVKHGLTSVEKTAYLACKSQMSGKKLRIKGRGTIWPVPKEICVCQSKHMTMIFKDGEYSSHKNVVAFLSDTSGLQTLQASDLKNSENPKIQFKGLVMSTINCVGDFQNRQDKMLEEGIVRNKEICGSSNIQITNICDRLRREGRI